MLLSTGFSIENTITLVLQFRGMNHFYNNPITQYKIEDAIQSINIIPLGHFVFLLCFFPMGMANPRLFVSLGIVLLFWGLKKYYTWQSSSVNLVLIFVYLAVVLIELVIFGFPSILLDISNNGLSKENIFGILIAMLPYVYVGLRVVLVFPLLSVFFLNLGLKHRFGYDDEGVLDSSFN